MSVSELVGQQLRSNCQRARIRSQLRLATARCVWEVDRRCCKGAGERRVPPDLLSDLRDIHEPVAPGFWPPAPGWWVVFGIAVVALVLATLLAKRWLRHRARLRMPYIAAERHIRVAARQHAAGEIDTRALADRISDVLKRVLVRVEGWQRATTAAGDAWTQALKERFPQPELAALRKALGDARFRPRFDADATGLATAAIDALQKAVRERTLVRPALRLLHRFLARASATVAAQSAKLQRLRRT